MGTLQNFHSSLMILLIYSNQLIQFQEVNAFALAVPFLLPAAEWALAAAAGPLILPIAVIGVTTVYLCNKDAVDKAVADTAQSIKDKIKGGPV